MSAMDDQFEQMEDNNLRRFWANPPVHETTLIETGDADEAMFSTIVRWTQGRTVGTKRLVDSLERALEVCNAPVVPTEEEVYNWLASKGTQLWGGGSLMDEAGIRQCAVWMHRQVQQLHEHATRERVK